MQISQTNTFSLKQEFSFIFWACLGAFLSAFAIEVFFIPNRLIDGGAVGIAMILANIFGEGLLPVLLLLANLPFLYLAWKFVGRTFLLRFAFANIFFVASVAFIHQFLHWEFHGDTLEVVVIGGALLGIGLGTIIRAGGCIDGTEILGIIVNNKTGITVGQVVLFCNVFVFSLAGVVFRDWHPAMLSLITYMVVVKTMDTVIVGLDETKSVLIISPHSKAISHAIMYEMGLGLTIMYGRGGFSGNDKEIIYVISERLQLAELKSLVYREDPSAFIAIENLHEVANGNQGGKKRKFRTQVAQLVKQLIG